MAKELKRFVQEGVFKMTDEQLRENCYNDSVGVFYSFGYYSANMKHLNEIKEEIVKDYPNKKDEDIEVWYIQSTESIRHARFTMLWTKIPINDYFLLKHEGKIAIL